MMKAGPLRVLGTMSGTSLDGVDAAVLETDGERILGFGPSAYAPYGGNTRAALKAALGRWPGEAGVAEAARLVEDAHVELMEGFDGVDLAGFHGQTLAHDPAGRGTHQAGDGRRLARRLGVPVAWDFRSEDVRAGGQGAPLAPFFHFALAKWIGATEPLVFLNLGGVGNLTWVDPTAARPEEPGALLAFDTGPANAPMDDAMQARRGVPRDDGGALAAEGQVDRSVLDDFLAHPYFRRPVPKSLDRDGFPGLVSAVQRLGDADALATLSAAVVESVALGVRACPHPPSEVLVGGGGRHNATLMRGLSDALDCPVRPVEARGLDGDMLEAQAFAFLAARVARGMAISGPMTTGTPRPTKGGILSFP